MAAKPLLAGYIAVYPLIKRRYRVKEYFLYADTEQGVYGLVYPVGTGMGQDIIKTVIFL
jgi:hypothetical protein